MDQESLEYGRQEMETLLSRLKTADCPGFNKPNYALVVPKNHPNLIARGSNSLVFELPPRKIQGRREYLVGKGFKYTEASTWEGVPEGELHLIGCNSGLTVDGYGLDTTHYWLKQLNLGLVLPLMREFHKSFGNKYIHFTIMPDLREGEAYQVDEAEDIIFEKLRNGEDLKKNRDRACRKLQQRAEVLNLEIHPAGHGIEENALPALEHIFLIQYSGDIGKLVIGDLNHLAIHERGRQFGTKPTYLDKQN